MQDLMRADSPERDLALINESRANRSARIIYLLDELDEETYHTVITAFHLMEKESSDPIHLHISTPGGSITAMFGIYDAIISSANEVVTIGSGEVCSAGVLLLAAGHKRYVTENCVLMSHQGSVEIEGKFDDVDARMKWVSWCEKRWTELMARHTNKDAPYWKRVSKKEAELWILGGDKIVESGIADEVIQPTHEAAKRES